MNKHEKPSHVFIRYVLAEEAIILHEKYVAKTFCKNILQIRLKHFYLSEYPQLSLYFRAESPSIQRA